MTQVQTRQLMKIGQVAESTNRSESSIWSDIRSGRLKTLRFGRSVRVHPDDFDDYMAAAAKTGSTDGDA